MDFTSITLQTPKETVSELVVQDLKNNGFAIKETDIDRPWGGFHRIPENQATQFIATYFANKDLYIPPGELLSPKILFVSPGIRLSWQYHNRRDEIWNVLYGPLGVILSATDKEGPVHACNTQSVIEIHKGIRHRAIGLENWGIWAEIWQHVDARHPSDEADIVRLQDDFGR